METLDSLLFKLHIMFLAEYDHENLFAKTKEEHKTDAENLSIIDRVELIESAGKKEHEEFEEGGRWSNYKTEIYRFYHDKKTIYVRITREVPASELQEGGDFEPPSIDIVEKKKVERFIYE